MPAHEALKELTQKLAHATTMGDIGRAMVSVAGHFGMTQCLIVDVTKLFDRIGPAIIFTTHAADEIETFDEHNPFLLHPFTQRARKSQRMFVVSQMRQELGATDEESWHALMPASLRDSDGFVIPVHDGGRLTWVAGFVGKKPNLSAASHAVMAAAVHAGYSLFHKLVEGRVDRSPLTARESECLHWVGEGKTDAEVGKILDISSRTVRFHITNAKRKLGVTSRIQAVTKRAAGR